MPETNKSDLSLFTQLLQIQFEDILSCAISIRSMEEDVETVHRFRVAIRKARSLLVFMKPLLKEAFFKQMNDSLKQFANHFAKVREWDVLMRYYRENYLSQVREEMRLTEFLLNEQWGHRQCAYAQYDPNFIASFIHVSLSDFKEKGYKHKALKGSWNAFIKQRTKTLQRNIMRLEKGLKPNDFKHLHAYRIANKRLRYALELLNPVIENAFDKQIKRLKAKTDQLGNRCDLYVMHEDLCALHVQNDEVHASLKDFNAFISAEMTKSEANGLSNHDNLC